MSLLRNNFRLVVEGLLELSNESRGFYFCTKKGTMIFLTLSVFLHAENPTPNLFYTHLDILFSMPFDNDGLESDAFKTNSTTVGVALKEVGYKQDRP